MLDQAFIEELPALMFPKEKFTFYENGAFKVTKAIERQGVANGEFSEGSANEESVGQNKEGEINNDDLQEQDKQISNEKELEEEEYNEGEREEGARTKNKKASQRLEYESEHEEEMEGPAHKKQKVESEKESESIENMEQDSNSLSSSDESDSQSYIPFKASHSLRSCERLLKAYISRGKFSNKKLLSDLHQFKKLNSSKQTNLLKKSRKSSNKEEATQELPIHSPLREDSLSPISSSPNDSTGSPPKEDNNNSDNFPEVDPYFPVSEE